MKYKFWCKCGAFIFVVLGFSVFVQQQSGARDDSSPASDLSNSYYMYQNSNKLNQLRELSLEFDKEDSEIKFPSDTRTAASACVKFIKHKKKGEIITEEELINVSRQLMPETLQRSTRCNTAGIPYLSNYKNPCFYVRYKEGLLLRCVPYFYLGGFQKSGTTALHGIIQQHPDYMPGAFGKEVHWWNSVRLSERGRYSKFRTNQKRQEYYEANIYRDDPAKLNEYLDVFKATSMMIEDDADENDFHVIITGDSSPDTLNGAVSDQPDNAQFIADDIHWLTPSAKFIIIMRNPTDRLLSWYNMATSRQKKYENNTSPRDFHEAVKAKLDKFKTCSRKLKPDNFEKYPCVYEKTFRSMSGTKNPHIFSGCYVAFVRHLLRVVPRQQILFIKFEDMARDIVPTARRIYRHLRLKIPVNIPEVPPQNESSNKMKMWNATRQLLDVFYRPFNRDLAVLLGSKKWLWKDRQKPT